LAAHSPLRTLAPLALPEDMLVHHDGVHAAAAVVLGPVVGLGELFALFKAAVRLQAKSRLYPPVLKRYGIATRNSRVKSISS